MITLSYYYKVVLSYSEESIPNSLYRFFKNHPGRIAKENKLEKKIEISFNSPEIIIEEQMREELKGFNIEDFRPLNRAK